MFYHEAHCAEHRPRSKEVDDHWKEKRFTIYMTVLRFSMQNGAPKMERLGVDLGPILAPQINENPSKINKKRSQNESLKMMTEQRPPTTEILQKSRFGGTLKNNCSVRGVPRKFFLATTVALFSPTFLQDGPTSLQGTPRPRFWLQKQKKQGRL